MNIYRFAALIQITNVNLYYIHRIAYKRYGNVAHTHHFLLIDKIKQSKQFVRLTVCKDKTTSNHKTLKGKRKFRYIFKLWVATQSLWFCLCQRLFSWNFQLSCTAAYSLRWQKKIQEHVSCITVLSTLKFLNLIITWLYIFYVN